MPSAASRPAVVELLDAFARAMRRGGWRWGGVEVPIVSPEDLVAMKILAGRRKDLDDVRGVLLEQAERLDLERTRDVLGALEAALDDARLLRRLDRQLAAVRKAASRASPARPKPRR